MRKNNCARFSTARKLCLTGYRNQYAQHPRFGISLISCVLFVAAFLLGTNHSLAQTISCPSNITVNAANGQCSATVNYGQPTTTLGGTTTRNFSYTGGRQTFTVPPGVTSIRVECWGGQGRNNARGLAGGRGGYARGNLAVSPGNTLNIYVGGGGGTSTGGGYNGGGAAGVGSSCSTARGGGGGGASDVRLNSTALSARRIVAGGGGGAGGNRIQGCGRGTGGGGGGGYYGGGGGAGWPYQSNNLPRGGTQGGGGAGGTSTWTTANNGFAGGLGTGGRGGTEVSSGQAGNGTAQTGGTGGGTSGGNGRYSVNWTGQSGAGGSGYTGGVSGGTMTSGSRSGNGYVRLTYTTVATVTQTSGQASGTSFPVGTTTNTFSDGGSTCSFTVRVIDNQNPSISCPSNQTVNAANGQCSRNVSYSTPTASDNCPGVTRTRIAGPASGSSFSVGSTTVTYRATDASGRTRTCSFSITVVDNQNPSISCPSNQTVSASVGQCSRNASYTTPSASDNCPGVTRTRIAGPASGSSFSVGSTTITYRATDAAGRTATCSFSITVVDLQNPSISCPSNQTVNASNGQCSQNVSYTTPSASDNCPGVTRTRIAGLASGASFPVGSNTVTYRATDAGGRTATCSFSITVVDNQNPSISCPSNQTVNAANGQCSRNVSYTTPSAADNCPGVTATRIAGGASGASFSVGSSTVTYRATDAAGRTATCSFTITVVDNQNPSISCPSNQTVNTANGQCSQNVSYTTPSAADNCPGVTRTRIAGLASGASFPVGTNTVTYRATDAAGRTATCSFTIRVNDNENPAISCPANRTVNNDPGLCTAVVSYSAPGGTDNCPGASTSRTAGLGSGGAFPVGTTTESYRVTDASGNTASCSFTVTVNDNENPVLTCPANITRNNDPGQCSATISYSVPGGSDNCPGATTTRTAGLGSGGTFPVGTTTESYLVTDAASNTATCSFTVTVNDNEDPVITCPANRTVNNDAGQCSAVVSYSVPGGSDNCPGATTTRTAGLGSGATFSVGTTTETYRATDAAGNTASCNFTVTVVDAEDPVIACPSNISLNSANGSCDRAVTYTAPVGTDNCPSSVTTRSAGLASGSTFSVGTSTVSYTVTDASGNTASCSFSVTINDNENPAISCPANITQNNDPGQCTAAISYGVPGGTDNCPGATTTRTAGLGSGGAFPVGTTTESYRVTDASGNTASCSFTVTVNDNENPVLTCPANITRNNDPGQCSATISYSVPGGSDNCPGATTTRTAGLGSGGTFPVGTTTESYRVTDAASNTASCSFTVTVNDNENPVIACPANRTVNNDAGQCSAVVSYSAPGGTDNCPGATTTRTAGLGSGATFSVGTTTETYRATDAAGNTASCNFTITVVDAEDPVISCPANISLNSANGSCDRAVTYTAPVGTDNCPSSVTTRSAGLASGSTFSVGTSTVSYTVTDASGNVDSCSFSVTINDNENPAISCPANIIRNNDPGQCTAAINYGVPGGTDNCPGATTTRTAGLGSGGAFPVGTTTESYRVTDAAGNTASCSFTVTVNDNENPVIACPANITRNNDAGQCSAALSYSPPGGTDNCPGATTTRTGGLGSGGTFPVGTTTESYRVNDAAGNTDSCSFTVTVLDAESPVIACPANITTNSANGQCDQNVTYTAPVGTDNCPSAVTTRSAGLSSGSTFSVGTSSVTYTVVDASGNTDSCSFSITVNDNEDPVIACPANVTVNNDPGQCSAVVSYSTPGGVDNCPGASTTRTAGLGSGSTFTIGTTTETYRVTDASGNTATCSFNITVNDNENPAITCPANITVNNDAGQCSAAVTYTAPGGTDNCPGASTARTTGLGSGGTFPVGTTTETYVVSDAASNTASCSFTVTVNDNENPAIACPANLTVNNDPGQCAAAVTYSPPGGTDNCPGATTVRSGGLGSGATFPVGSSTESYRVTDAAGNTADCSFTITVNDNENPVIACPANVTVNNDPGQCSAVVSYSVPGGTDNCPGASTARTNGLGSGGTFPVGSSTETYTVTDASGNTANCSFTILVNDNENPVIACPANVTVNNDPGQCSAVVSYSVPGGSDNCPGASTTRTTGLGSGGTFSVGSTTETYTVTDAAGNTASCSFTILVNDNENPAITCPANVTVNNDPGQCSAVLSYSVPGGTDNCPGASTSRAAGLGSGGTFPVGSTTETYTVTDAAGNTASCSFSIAVNDNENPVIACPANVTVSNDPGQCSAVVSYSVPGGTDNCPGASTALTSGLGNGGTFVVGTATETYQVTDASGNTASCSFTVTVNDNENPVIACPANISVGNDIGQCSAVVSYSVPGGTDNCPGASTTRTAGLGSGGTFAVGTSTETYTVTDAAGNSASCSFSITVNDNENPAITCPANITVNNDPGLCSAVVPYTAPTGLDNCPGASTSRTAGLGSNGTFAVGSSTETFTVTDAAGNTANCSFTITVNDNEDPMALCSNQTVQLDGNGNASTSASAVNNNSTDNCGIQGISLSNPAFTCNDLGANTVTLTVTDIHGNTSSCNATITVEDNVAPQALCQNITVQLPASGDSTLPAINVNGGSTDNCTISNYSLSRDRFVCNDIGSNPVTMYVTDQSGNLDSCSATVTVVDALGLTLRSIDIGADTTICNQDTLNLDVGPGFVSHSWSTGATSQAIDIYGPGIYSVISTDSIGCIGRDTFSLTVDTVDNPNIRSLGGPAILCLNDTLGLGSDPGYAAYLWSNGDTSSNTQITSGGNIFLTVTAPFGCSRTDTFFVDQRNLPDPNPIIDPGGDTINLCGTDPIMLNVRGGYASYQWSTGDTTQTVVATPGTYLVTVTNGFGCWNVSDEKVVRQVTPVAPSIQINGDTLCASSGSNFQWYFNGNAIILANSQCYVAAVPGSYWVQVDDLYDCPVNSDTILIVSTPDRITSNWDLNAYPNPFSESTFITFEAPERTRVIVEVFSLTGVKVATLMDREVFSGENVKLEFNPEDKAAGVYIFRMHTESGQMESGKLILTR